MSAEAFHSECYLNKMFLNFENMNQRNEELVPHNGNYKKLLSYQKANTIYCLTYYFVKRYIH